MHAYIIPLNQIPQPDQNLDFRFIVATLVYIQFTLVLEKPPISCNQQIKNSHQSLGFDLDLLHLQLIQLSINLKLTDSTLDQ